MAVLATSAGDGSGHGSSGSGGFIQVGNADAKVDYTNNNRAFVGVTITNATTGDAVNAPPGPSPRLLLCRSPNVCDLLPLLVMTGGLVPPGTDRNGLTVRVQVEVENLDGVSASVEREAVLSTTQL